MHERNTDTHYMCLYHPEHDTPHIVRMYRNAQENMPADAWHDYLSKETAALYKQCIDDDTEITVFHALSLPDITAIDTATDRLICQHIKEVAAQLANPSLWTNNVTTIANVVYTDSSTAVLKNIDTVINNGMDQSQPDNPTMFCNVFTNITAGTCDTNHYTGE